MKQKFRIISSIILLIFSLCSTTEAHIDSTGIEWEQKYLGDYRITFYCGGPCCCGEWAGSPTASGTTPKAKHTCACGNDIPYGTVLYVQGLGYYVCEDRGVGSGCLDIYVDNHSDIPSWGLAYIATYQIQ